MLPLQSWVSAAAVSQWHEGCLCELKQTAATATSDLAMPAIFGTSFFKQSGRVSQFCPCSIETVQRLNSELIMPRLLPLLNRTFFRYVKLDLERPCPFWDDPNPNPNPNPHPVRIPLSARSGRTATTDIDDAAAAKVDTATRFDEISKVDRVP